MTEDEREMLLEMPAVRELLREAIAEERDACAAICDRFESQLACAAAVAIRKRGQP